MLKVQYRRLVSLYTSTALSASAADYDQESQAALRRVGYVLTSGSFLDFLDLHEQRLKKLRDLTKVIAQDDWMYPSADKLIGLKWSRDRIVFRLRHHPPLSICATWKQMPEVDCCSATQFGLFYVPSVCCRLLIIHLDELAACRNKHLCDVQMHCDWLILHRFTSRFGAFSDLM